MKCLPEPWGLPGDAAPPAPPEGRSLCVVPSMVVIVDWGRSRDAVAKETRRRNSKKKRRIEEQERREKKG